MEEEKATIIQDQAPETPQETPQAPEERERQYVPILPGDTLETIAERYQTDVQTIIDENKMNPDWFFPNQWIWV